MEDPFYLLVVVESDDVQQRLWSLICTVWNSKCLTSQTTIPLNFTSATKSILQVAGIEGTGVVFYVEDHHIHVLNDVLETINSLLSSGEVPGLYTHEELEPLLAPLREQMMQVDGYFRTPYEFFLHQIKKESSCSSWNG